MNCRGVLDALSDYLEGDGGSTICRRIEEHIRGCDRCRMHIDAMKKIIVLYTRWRTEPIPDDVQMRLKQVVARECVPNGADPAPGSPGASSVAAGGKTGKRPGARGRRKPAASKQAKSSKRSPRRR